MKGSEEGEEVFLILSKSLDGDQLCSKASDFFTDSGCDTQNMENWTASLLSLPGIILSLSWPGKRAATVSREQIYA